MGKGKYYVGHPEYQRRFADALGYKPYPGTLNVKLNGKKEEELMVRLRSMKGIGIGGFTADGEPMSALICYQGRLKGEKVTILAIDVTHYNESVAELISPAYLRGEFGIKDGDEVEFEVESEDSSRPRQ